MKSSVFFVMLITLSINVRGQQDCHVLFSGDKADVALITNRLVKPLDCDSAANAQMLSGIMAQLHQKGHLLASYATNYKGDSLTVEVFVGKRYSWAQLNTAGIPDQVLHKSGFRSKDYRQGPFNHREIKRLFKGIITQGENEGYPFVAVQLDSVHINDGKIAARLVYDTGPKITFDSLKFDESVSVKKKWLATYLAILPDAPFSQKKIETITTRINALGFLTLNNEPRVSFQNKQATVLLDLESRKSSRIDGIIGFLPNEEEQGRLLITGQFDLSLRNLFSSGKGLDIQWQSLRPRSQLLDIHYSHPNLFRSSLDFDGSFHLLREDTTFVTRQAELNFTFRPSQHSFTLFAQFRSSNLLRTDNLRDVTELPDLSDFNVDYYGVKYGFNMLNDVTLPTSGIAGFIHAGVGSKRIQVDPNLPGELFDDVDLNSLQLLFELGFKSYWRWNKHLVFYHNINAARVSNDRLFLNDLFRVGGLTSLRGFNENFFFASDYVLSNVELQFYFQPASYFFAFYDQSYLFFDIENSVFEDYPLGIGIGLNLATSSGVVSLAYGVGRAEEQPLSLSLSKFHFGYIAKF